jgi:hypothetical protein
MNDERLEVLLGSAFKRDACITPADEAAAARVAARLGALPRQKGALWRLPGTLLDWQFAPAWPRVAALASCAVLGFAIGLSGIDNVSPRSDAPYSFVSGGYSGTLIFDSDPAGGANP